MRRWVPTFVKLLVVVVCAIGAWVGWHRGVVTGWFPPVDGAPGYRSTSYSGSWIACVTVLSIVGCATVVELVRGLCSVAPRIPRPGIMG